MINFVGGSALVDFITSSTFVRVEGVASGLSRSGFLCGSGLGFWGVGGFRV